MRFSRVYPCFAVYNLLFFSLCYLKLSLLPYFVGVVSPLFFADVEFCSETTQLIYFVFYLCKYGCGVEMLIFPPLDFGCLGFNLYFCR